MQSLLSGKASQLFASSVAGRTPHDAGSPSSKIAAARFASRFAASHGCHVSVRLHRDACRSDDEIVVRSRIRTEGGGEDDPLGRAISYRAGCLGADPNEPGGTEALPERIKWMTRQHAWITAHVFDEHTSKGSSICSQTVACLQYDAAVARRTGKTSQFEMNADLLKIARFDAAYDYKQLLKHGKAGDTKGVEKELAIACAAEAERAVLSNASRSCFAEATCDCQDLEKRDARFLRLWRAWSAPPPPPPPPPSPPPPSIPSPPPKPSVAETLERSWSDKREWQKTKHEVAWKEEHGQSTEARRPVVAQETSMTSEKTEGGGQVGTTAGTESTSIS